MLLLATYIGIHICSSCALSSAKSIVLDASQVGLVPDTRSSTMGAMKQLFSRQ